MQDRYGGGAGKMLNGLVFRSGHLEFSGQSGKDRGDEKSARPGPKLRVVPGGRAGQDRPKRAGLGRRTRRTRTPAHLVNKTATWHVALPAWGRKAARRGNHEYRRHGPREWH